MGRIGALIRAAVFVLLVAPATQAAEIGVASSVRNNVQGDLFGAVRDLSSGDGVSQDERISTGSDSATQLLFLDNSSVTMGPEAVLTLNHLVFDPDRSSSLTVGAAQGAFRFVSGLSKPSGYRVETPAAIVGIRGSIVEGYVDAITGEEAIILLQGVIEICLRAAQPSECQTLSEPGTFIYINADGELIGPRVWRGPLLTQDAAVDFVEFIRLLSRNADPLRRTERGERRTGDISAPIFFPPL